MIKHKFQLILTPAELETLASWYGVLKIKGWNNKADDLLYKKIIQPPK